MSYSCLECGAYGIEPNLTYIRCSNCGNMGGVSRSPAGLLVVGEFESMVRSDSDAIERELTEDQYPGDDPTLEEWTFGNVKNFVLMDQ